MAASTVDRRLEYAPLVNLLAISGSLRSDSSNSRLLMAAQLCTPPGTTISLVTCIGELPQFNPDHDPERHAVTKTWVNQVRQADGLIVSTPEYAGGYPGSLKNAFDWLVQTDAHLSKPFMMLHASERSFTARDTLAKVIETMDGRQVTEANRTIHLVGNLDPVDKLCESYGDELRNSLHAFVGAVTAMKEAQ